MDDELLNLLRQDHQKKKRQRTLEQPSTPSTAPAAPAPVQAPPPPAMAPSLPSATRPAPHVVMGPVPFRIQNPKRSSDEVAGLLKDRKLVKISSLSTFLYGQTPASLPDYALAGVVGHKMPARRSQSGTAYVEWALDDLQGHSVKVMLFGEALGGGQNVPLGMVCLLLQPKPMGGGNKPGQLAATTLSLFHTYQLLPIGACSDFGSCSYTIRGDLPCNAVFNKSAARFCAKHMAPRPALKAGAPAAASKGMPNRVPTSMLSLPAAAMVPTSRGRAAGGGGLIVRPNLVGRSTNDPKRKTPTLAAKKPGGGGKVEKIQKMVKQDQPHRAHRWSATLVNKNVRPDAASDDVTGRRGAKGGASMENDYLRTMTATLEADEVKKDGKVAVPGPSKLFDRGADGVAYATYKHNEEAQRMAREESALQVRQQQQQRSEAKAVMALKNGGMIRMAPKAPGAGAPATVVVPGTAPMPATVLADLARRRQQQQQQQKGLSLEEAEKLMSSKSKHSSEARSELLEQLNGVFESLGEKEDMVERVKSLSSLQVTAYHCQDCDRFYEKCNPLCAERRHRFQKVQTKKRFFICGNRGCPGETAVLGASAPQESCSRCGEKLWRAKGKGKALDAPGAGGKGGGVEKLIPAVSEFNRHADISALYN